MLKTIVLVLFVSPAAAQTADSAWEMFFDRYGTFENAPLGTDSLMLARWDSVHNCQEIHGFMDSERTFRIWINRSDSIATEYLHRQQPLQKKIKLRGDTGYIYRRKSKLLT